MREQYGNAVARHYAAFRPDLHAPILSRTIEEGERFSIGIDLGCGAGHSTVALAKYCDQVFGVDRSPMMLAHAAKHAKVAYLLGDGENLREIPDLPVDLVAFAGSLPYLKTDGLRTQLPRICRSGATIVVYDFEIDVDLVLDDADLSVPAAEKGYDHAANLHCWREFCVTATGQEPLQLALSSEELGHVVLADLGKLNALSTRFRTNDPYREVVKRLSRVNGNHQLQATSYNARYEFLPRHGRQTSDAFVDK
ncbi:MAG: class I SAM-dependent methyltransferase [Planctomycetota bacterium]